MAGRFSFRVTLLAAGVLSAGCNSMYFSALEAVGMPKRDLLVSRVEDAKESQEAAKEQFHSALQVFKMELKVQGGELEEKYNTLKAELDRSESRASDVKKRINRVEDVSEALFREWESELDKYNNSRLRESSEEKLRNSKTRYREMIAAMRRVEAKLEPALQPLRDDVLYLKHNLNAQALRSLGQELHEIEGNVEELVQELDVAIQEADGFIREIERG